MSHPCTKIYPGDLPEAEDTPGAAQERIAFPMQVNKPDLLMTLSPERLAPFLATTKGDLDLALKLYGHNQAIAETLYVPLQNLEVGLRNRRHGMLTRQFGWTGWDRDFIRKLSQSHAISEAKAKLRMLKRTLRRQAW